MADEIVGDGDGAKEVPLCRAQITRTQLVQDEFRHTQKRLARGKVLTVVQFSVFAFNCPDKSHTEENTFHIGYASVGSDVVVPGGLQTAIAATEQLLAALKAKLQ